LPIAVTGIASITSTRLGTAGRSAMCGAANSAISSALARAPGFSVT
jgi:hypothetical protein